MRKIKLKAWILVGAVWLVPGIYYAFQVYFEHRLDKTPASGVNAAMHGMIFWFLWAAATPLIVKLARAFPLERERWTDGLQFHLPAGLIFSLLHLLLYVILTSSIESGHLPFSVEELLADFQRAFLRSFAWWSLVYWAVLIASYAYEYQERYRTGLLHSTQLEAQLSQAELRALRMQLHPHFLFNTLNSISALLHVNPEAADRMIARLGDFLRMTLANQSSHPSHEVTLSEELSFLELYLSIERERFRERLQTRIDVSPEAQALRVPNLLLQPLVENALRHGIARLERPGLLQVRARIAGDHLRLEVEDDGPGIEAIEAARSGAEGVGLKNTRSRLEALYGENHRFSITKPSSGGMLVTIELPLSRDAIYV